MTTEGYTSITPAHSSPLARRLLAASLMLLPLIACTPEPDLGSGPESESAWDFTSKLRSCGLVTDGTMLGDGVGLDQTTLCYFNCLAEGTCEQLETMMCGDPHESYELQEACLDACESAPFVCASGDQIPGSWECDLEADCADGSDEIDCGEPQYFTCEDGEQIPASWECDLEADCADGSDETDCAQLLCN